MPTEHDSFLNLVRLGLGHPSNDKCSNLDWQALKALADRQGLTAVVLDGIESLPDNQRPPQVLLLEWIGEVLQNYEQRYAQYKEAVGSLAGFYNQHGYKMMVLKGYACSLDWPRPEHRPCGDIDIWLLGKQKEADKDLAKEDIKIDNSHHHHSVFYWKDFMVENHYDFINIHHHKSNVELDKQFKSLAEDDSHFVDVVGNKVLIPSPNLHAFFLLRHAMNHFSSSEITLRQLLDWAFFVEKHGSTVDWNSLMKNIEYFGMKELYGVFNSICVSDLGFDSSKFHYLQSEKELKERVLNEILTPEFSEKEPKGFFKRVCFKYRRWKANEWKHQLCYKDSMWSAFWSGVWSHLVKPSTI